MKKQWKKEQKICSRCHDKPAISFKAGDVVVNTVDGYDLCPRCYRDTMNRNMAAILAQQGTFQPLTIEPAALSVTEALQVAA